MWGCLVLFFLMPWKSTYWVKTRHAAQCLLSQAVPTGHAKISVKELETGLHGVFSFWFKPDLCAPPSCCWCWMCAWRVCDFHPLLVVLSFPLWSHRKRDFGQLEWASPVVSQFLLVNRSGFSLAYQAEVSLFPSWKVGLSFQSFLFVFSFLCCYCLRCL